MKRTLIKGANLCVGDNELITRDVLFDENGIIAIGEEINEAADDVIAAQGCLLSSGLIDVHVHLREPGYEAKETIDSGTRAAAHGGFTTIMAMPNVKPVPDEPTIMETYRRDIAAKAHVQVIPYASITKAEAGKQIVDFHAFRQMGIQAFSDDGVGVGDDEIMREAMHQSAKEDIILAAHTEDMRYRREKSCIHEGMQSKAWGLVGIPGACEYEQIRRDLKLVKESGAHYHICHISAKESVELLRQAKAAGLDVSGEVTPHHLLLNETDMRPHANYKMNPPLRGSDDQKALLAGIQNGVIDMIASDHAPHTKEEKAKGMVEAPFGIVGLETAFPLLYTHLVKSGKITLQRLLELMSTNPAKRFRMNRKGLLQAGYAADLTLIDLHQSYIIDKADFYSKGKNTPFDGWKVYGKVMMTIVQGKIVYCEQAFHPQNKDIKEKTKSDKENKTEVKR